MYERRLAIASAETVFVEGMNTLARTAFEYPAIDNHAHPLLKEVNRDAFPFEGLISEANGSALTEDAVHTLACYRATKQLSDLFRLDGEPDWENLKRARRTIPYDELCRTSMGPAKIQCILIDDGLGGVAELAEDYKWHDQFTPSSTKRIARVEVIAEGILKDLLDAQILSEEVVPYKTAVAFAEKLDHILADLAADPEVVAFKSIACYRTGLDISVTQDSHAIEKSLVQICLRYATTKTFRLADRVLNDFIVCATLHIASVCGKPVQFHTGLGDNDITLTRSSPAYMQPLIKAYPDAPIVLLHSSYPYTRDAGYLAATYPNVFLDFGEVFPFLSAEGQLSVVRQVLELCPTNKIMWSTDGHWWPESYYLGALQGRETLYRVLQESVGKGEMTESQAISVVKRALFDNANRIYKLGLKPHI